MWRLTFSVVVLLAVVAAQEEHEDCKCVPYYLCSEDEYYYGDVPRIDRQECPSYLDVCCKNPNKTDSVDSPVKVHEKVCGKRNPEGIGSTNASNAPSKQDEAKFAEFPWTVGVLEVQRIISPGQGEEKEINVYQCGGSLIHPSVVLTSAHCVSEKKEGKFKIRAGEWDVQTKSEIFGHQDRDVEKIVVHENFKSNNNSLSNDVALLFLSKPVDPEENIGFACLPTKEYITLPSTRCIASGWGKGKEGKYESVLKKLELPVVDFSACQELLRKTKLGETFVLENSFLCAGGVGKDTCTGDRGSPLVCPLKDLPNKYVQSGIVSWGVGCGNGETPGVYTNVALFRDWIDSIMALENHDNSYYVY